MRINTLSIHTFGKLHNKTIHFDDGLNLIYGLNEQGKSTVHKFIEAMFYGFFKAYTKNRQYEDAYDMYLPWDHEGYGGTLTFEDEGREIRLERQLTKGKESLKLFDVASGEDITESYAYNKVIRQVNPGLRHFGHNKITYRNTVSMTQMESKTDEAMVAEIKDNMSNLASTHQAVISVDSVIEKIEKMDSLIGSERKRTSPYAQLRSSVEDLNNELMAAKVIHQDISREKVHENQLSVESDALAERSLELKKDLQYIKVLKNKELIDKAESIQAEQQQTLQIVDANEVYKDFTVEEADKIRQLGSEIRSKEQELKIMNDKSSYLQGSIEQLEIQERDVKEAQHSDLEFEHIQKAVIMYDERMAVLRMKETEQQTIINHKKLVSEEEDPKGIVVPIGILLVVLAGVVYASIEFSPFIWIVAMVIAGLIASTFAKYRNQKDIYKSYRQKTDQLDQAIEALDVEKDAINIELKEILNKEQVYDYYTLHAKRDKMLSGRSIAESKAMDAEKNRSMYTKVQKDITDNKDQHQTLTMEIEDLSSQMQRSLTAWQLDTEDGINEGLNAHMAYVKALGDKAQFDMRMQELLDGQSLEGMKGGCDLSPRPVEDDDEDAIKVEIEENQERALALSKEISASVTKQSTLLQTARTVVEIEEAIHAQEMQLAAYDHELAVTALMRQTIEAIAVDIQNNFAPALNESMSTVVQSITGDKYSDIKVNPAMQLTIYDEKAHRTIAAEKLSAGTIDILYFGLRLGISEVLTEGKKLPLILDDTFVQYDDERLEHVIDLLSNQNRQVLLFTCHMREMKYLSAQEVPYNKVILSVD